MYLQELTQVFLQKCHLIFSRKLLLLFDNVVLHFGGSFVVGTTHKVAFNWRLLEAMSGI